MTSIPNGHVYGIFGGMCNLRVLTSRFRLCLLYVSLNCTFASSERGSYVQVVWPLSFFLSLWFCAFLTHCQSCGAAVKEVESMHCLCGE